MGQLVRVGCGLCASARLLPLTAHHGRFSGEKAASRGEQRALVSNVQDGCSLRERTTSAIQGLSSPGGCTASHASSGSVTWTKETFGHACCMHFFRWQTSRAGACIPGHAPGRMAACEAHSVAVTAVRITAALGRKHELPRSSSCTARAWHACAALLSAGMTSAAAKLPRCAKRSTHPDYPCDSAASERTAETLRCCPGIARGRCAGHTCVMVGWDCWLTPSQRGTFASIASFASIMRIRGTGQRGGAHHEQARDSFGRHRWAKGSGQIRQLVQAVVAGLEEGHVHCQLSTGAVCVTCLAGPAASRTFKITVAAASLPYATQAHVRQTKPRAGRHRDLMISADGQICRAARPIRMRKSSRRVPTYQPEDRLDRPQVTLQLHAAVTTRRLQIAAVYGVSGSGPAAFLQRRRDRHKVAHVHDPLRIDVGLCCGSDKQAFSSTIERHSSTVLSGRRFRG